MVTFPATRRLLQRALAMRGLSHVLRLAALFVAGVPYIFLRSAANSWREPVDGTRYERALFRGMPTEWLQNALYSGSYGWFERLWVYVHVSWFVIPPAATVFVL